MRFAKHAEGIMERCLYKRARENMMLQTIRKNVACMHMRTLMDAQIFYVLLMALGC